MIKRAVFVTGTDTGAGKSIVAGLLGRYFREKGYQSITQKWIQTGCRGFSQDIELHLRLMKIKKRQIRDYLVYLCPYVFKYASSPHLAARLENRVIDAAKIREYFYFLLERFDIVIVEGVGGVEVPFNSRMAVVDIARELNLPALIVSANKLGAINHTLLTIDAIKRRGMEIAGIIFNSHQARGDRLILEDNPQIIKRMRKERVLGVLPQAKSREALYKSFLPIGKKFIDLSR